MATVTETTADTVFTEPVQTPTFLAARSLLSTAPPSPSQLPTFSFTPFLLNTAGHHLITTVPACPQYLAGNCPLGRRCPNRHPTPTNEKSGFSRKTNDSYVCKHWLKGLCKKGDNCDYLHEYNLHKMSECQFYNQNGFCQNGDECLYLHVKEESRLPLCEDYERGFCEKGPRCKHRHVRKKFCEFYMAGFCPDGPECKKGVHLRAPVPGTSSGPGTGAIKLEDGEERDLDGDRRMEDDSRGGDNHRGRGRYAGRGRWRNKR